MHLQITLNQPKLEQLAIIIIIRTGMLENGRVALADLQKNTVKAKMPGLYLSQQTRIAGLQVFGHQHDFRIVNFMFDMKVNGMLDPGL